MKESIEVTTPGRRDTASEPSTSAGTSGYRIASEMDVQWSEKASGNTSCAGKRSGGIITSFSPQSGRLSLCSADYLSRTVR